VTTQIPTWREPSSPGRPGDRAAPGTVVGDRYALRTPIGHGGMGTVWRAADTLLRRDVAVKEVLLPPAMPKSERDALCERTLREARAAAALSHPSVVQVYDVVTDGGRPWIVMELLEARSLADMVIDDGPLPQRAVAKIGIAMLGALEVAHAAGVLHRDVKPANVLICADGRCVLTDFGVARLPTESKLTTPGMVLGSPHFISPERAVGGNFGPPSDLFSLGVTLYTAVEGGPPFDRGDPFETMRAVVEEPPRPVRLAGPLQPVLWGLLDKEPDRRWSVDHARGALRELLGGPLSRTGSAHLRHDTDPQAVMRPPAGQQLPAPPAPARPAGRVGGRAMLDPDEPLTGQLARLRNQTRPGSRPLLEPDEWQSTDGIRRGGEAGGREAGSHDAEGHEAGGRAAGRRDVARREGGTRGPRGPATGGPGTGGPATGARETDGRRTGGRRRARGRGAIMMDGVADRVRGLGQQARRQAQAPQNRSRLIVGAGLAAVLVLAAAGAMSGLFGGSGNPGTPHASGTAVGPSATSLVAMQEYADRGIVLNVPKDWTQGGSGSYVDFADPAGGRRIRINVENTSATARRVLQLAESNLKKPSVCPTPYKRVGLRDQQLDGQAGAELEYTCGTGTDMRHGIWRALVVNAKAYTFYLTVPDTRFAESRPIFDEMVRSFHLAA